MCVCVCVCVCVYKPGNVSRGQRMTCKRQFSPPCAVHGSISGLAVSTFTHCVISLMLLLWNHFGTIYLLKDAISTKPPEEV